MVTQSLEQGIQTDEECCSISLAMGMVHVPNESGSRRSWTTLCGLSQTLTIYPKCCEIAVPLDFVHLFFNTLFFLFQMACLLQSLQHLLPLFCQEFQFLCGLFDCIIQHLNSFLNVLV